MADFLQEEEESLKEALVVTMPCEKGDKTDLDAPSPPKTRTELPQDTPEPAPDTELPLEDRRQVQGHPEAGALGPSRQDRPEGSPVQAPGQSLLLGEQMQSPRPDDT